MSTLTSDNSHLSRPTQSPEVNGLMGPETASRAINCNVSTPSIVRAINCTQSAGEAVERYVNAGMSSNTRHAYADDLKHFSGWGGVIPSSPDIVAAYLAEHAGVLSTSTLVRRLAAIGKAHRSLGYVSPTNNELVRATMRGIKRQHGTAQRQAKALVRDDLFIVLDALGDGLKDVRDRALLLIGFAGGFRRSELVGLNVEDIEQVRQGVIIIIRQSKTDQTGQGRRVGIPFGRTRHCPVFALEKWFDLSGISEGPIFRPVTRHGGIGAVRLSGEAVSLVVKERVAASEIDPTEYSGHSLRSGFATSAAQAGVSSWKIRAQTGHASDAMLSRYIREGELFTDNATGQLL